MTKSISPARVIVADVSTQFRLRAGDEGSHKYIPACRSLSAWARPTEANKALVHALVHLGWQSTSGARAKVLSSQSKAWAPTTGLGARDVLEVGEDAAEAAVRVLGLLAEAGAPADMLEVVWDTFTA
jgi:hypothetical protein